jgi:hypothetical protein
MTDTTISAPRSNWRGESRGDIALCLHVKALCPRFFVADDAFEERSVRLGPGDRLYLYSDGVPEAMGPAGKQFGDARLLETIGQSRSEPLQASVATLLGEIGRWHGSQTFQDDISILTVEMSIASAQGEPGATGLVRPRADRYTQ